MAGTVEADKVRKENDPVSAPLLGTKRPSRTSTPSGAPLFLSGSCSLSLARLTGKPIRKDIIDLKATGS